MNDKLFNLLVFIMLLILSIDSLQSQNIQIESRKKKNCVKLNCQLTNSSSRLLFLRQPEFLKLGDTIKEQPYFIDDLGVVFRLDTLHRMIFEITVDDNRFENTDSIEIMIPVENPLKPYSHVYITVYKSGEFKWIQGPERNRTVVAGGQNRIRANVKKYKVRY